MSKNHYSRLGVSEYSTTDQIKSAYKKLELQYESIPKKTKSLYRIMRRICSAYKILKDPDLRADYNAKNGLVRRKRDRGDSEEDAETKSAEKVSEDSGIESPPKRMRIIEEDREISDVSKAPTKRILKFRAGQHKQVVKDPPLDYDLFVTLEEIDSGCVKTYKISRFIKSRENEAVKTTTKMVTITIPPGCNTGEKIIFPNEGDQIKGSAPSDVIFNVRVKEHPVFKRDGANLECTVPYKRGKVEIPLLNGDTILTDSNDGRELRLQGYGLKCSNNINYRGSLTVKFDL